MCAFQPNIPQPNDRLRTSQGDLLGNFQASAGGLGTMLNPNQGYIQFPNQGAVPTLTGSQPGFFAKLTAAPQPVTGVSELFVNKNVQGLAFRQIPMTASILSTNATPVTANPGWTYLPSGIILQWGTANIADNSNLAPVNFAITFPNACLQVIVSVNNNANPAPANIPPQIYNSILFSTTQFQIASRAGNSGNSSGYTYLAIGY